MAKPNNRQRNTRTDEAGMTQHFRPAHYEKPERWGLLRRISEAYRAAFGKVRPEQTTEQGASSSASITSSKYNLFALRNERREKIADCRVLYEDDPRARRSVDMYCREAV